MSDNIFNSLKKIDRGTAVYEEEKDTFSPFMTMKWMAATKDPTRIKLVNNLLNSHLFALGKEKELLFNICKAISDGKDKRYNWIKRPKKTPENILTVVSEYYEISNNEAADSLSNLSKENILDMSVELGYTDKEIKGLKKSLNATELL